MQVNWAQTHNIPTEVDGAVSVVAVSWAERTGILMLS